MKIVYRISEQDFIEARGSSLQMRNLGIGGLRVACCLG
jgi:hypothetical protein